MGLWDEAVFTKDLYEERMARITRQPLEFFPFSNVGGYRTAGFRRRSTPQIFDSNRQPLPSKVRVVPNATGCVLVNLARLDIVVNGDYYVAVAGDAAARSYPALGVDRTGADDKRVLTGYVSILADGYLKRGSVRVDKHRCALGGGPSTGMLKECLSVGALSV
ncbi:MAG: hypothetical protein QW801_03800 [Candidatus Caldarchaeum sp.]